MVLVKPLTVHWHQESAPIYSACFQPREQQPPLNRSTRLITAGGDNNARIWRLKLNADPQEMPNVEYYSTLDKHERAVNAVAFDPLGQVLASAGDDGVVCLWALNEASSGPEQAFGADYEDLESWRLVRKCRTASFGEIYDLAWSPSGRYLAATSMDKVVSILDTTDGSCVAALRDHKHYVQGVCWDPLNEFLATQSSDQRVLIYPIKQDANGKSITIGSPSVRLDRAEIDELRTASFHPESFSSFFRRLSFSPDGAILVVPAGQIDQSQKPAQDKVSETKPETKPETVDEAKFDKRAESIQTNEPEPSSELEGKPLAPPSETIDTPNSKKQVLTQSCALVYRRNNLRRPAATLPLPKSSLAVKFCPTLFKLRDENGNKAGRLVDLPYRMVFAVATLNGVFLYDTERLEPLGMASNLHYSTITDLAWSPDGLFLLLTSIDGFCSLFKFSKGELGEPYTQEQKLALPAAAAHGPLPMDPSSNTPPAVAPALGTAQVQRQPVVNMLPVRKKAKRAEPIVAAPSETAKPSEPGKLSESSVTTETKQVSPKKDNSEPEDPINADATEVRGTSGHTRSSESTGPEGATGVTESKQTTEQ